MNCSYCVCGNTYYGTTPKYRLDINAGMPMSDFDFDVKLINGSNHITIEKSDMPVDSDGYYYLCFDTTDLGIGRVKAVITAYIDDQDYDGGVRREVFVINNLLYIKEV